MATKTADPLARYNAKRDFTKTAEPAGTIAKAAGHSFMVQKHDATRLHWDLRLEVDGVSSLGRDNHVFTAGASAHSMRCPDVGYAPSSGRRASAPPLPFPEARLPARDARPSRRLPCALVRSLSPCCGPS